MIERLALFGASGDLTSRYLLPALARLYEADHLPHGFQVVGAARDEWDTSEFQHRARESLQRHAASVASTAREKLVSCLQYRRADVTSPEQVAESLQPLDQPLVVYLALPPFLFAPTIQALARVGLPDGSRLVVEKPFGENLASAQALNRLLHDTFPEQAIYRLDHFLGERTFQNILGLRFANRVLEPLWNCQHVERVEITWDETLTVEGRAAYYDAAGALRDMLQNHLLQLLCLVAMEAPLTLAEHDLRGRKVEVLRAVRRLAPEAVERLTLRGRYAAGRIGERVVPAYVEEPGVRPEQRTETFARLTLFIDNWRWAGVPFVLRTGKALRDDRREIVVFFRPVPHLAFGPHAGPLPNALRLELEPDRVALALNITRGDDPFGLEHVELERELAPARLPAYGHLLLDVLRGNPSFSIRDDEAEESWRIVEPILQAWQQGRSPLLEYPAGSLGPAARAL